MLLIYPFHAGDQERALRTAQWIAELGTVEDHQCLIVHDKFADPQIAADVKNALGSAFRHVVLMPLREGAPGVRGMNLLFRRAARQVQASSAGPFLWMNPDAVPLRQGWLDAIEVAWKMLPRGKHFLGCHIGGAVPHMAAVGVYAQDAEVHAPNLVMAENNPFNLNAAPQVVPKMAHTELITDSHESPLLDLRDNEPPMLPARAVLWHGSPDCKSGDVLLALEVALRDGRLTALPIVEPKPDTRADHQSNGRAMQVPRDPIKVDRSAQRAASLAGSEGIPAEELDTNTQVPAVKPPTVTPIAAQPKAEAVAATAAAITTAAHHVSQNAAVGKPPAAEDIAALVQSLARIRDNSPADKATVLAALRAAGFPITGKQAQKKGGRK